MNASWIRGLGLAALLAMTASASAQGPKKEFKRPEGGSGGGAGFPGGGGFGGGPGGGPGGGMGDIQRIRAEMKELDAKITKLSTQIDETTLKLDRAALGAKIADKYRGEGPKGKDFKGKDGKGPPMAGGSRFEPKREFEHPKGPPAEFGRGPGGFERGGMSRGGPPSFGRGPGGFGPPRERFDPRHSAASRGSAGIEDRLSRIEQTLEEIRRDLRPRR